MNKTHKAKCDEELRKKSLAEERKLRTRRLFVIITEFVHRTKLALLLPIIVQNHQGLKICLSGTKYEFVSDLIQDFHANKEKAEYAMPKYINRDADEIIETILTNHEIIKYLPQKWFDNLSPGEIKLFRCLEHTLNIAQIRFCRGPFQELDIQQVAHEFYQKSEEMIAETEYLEKKLQSRRVSSFWKKVAREVVVHHLGRRLQSKAFTFETNFQTETESITRQLKKARQLHALKEKELEDQNQIAKNVYETSLHYNLEAEKIAAAEQYISAIYPSARDRLFLKVFPNSIKK